MSRHLRVKHGDRPEPGTEPGIQHVLILTKVFHLDIRADSTGRFKRRFRRGLHHVTAVRKVISRNPLSPPELAGNTPVAGILHPVAVGIHIFFRNELRPAAFDRFQGHLGEGFHLEEPLGAETRFNDGIRALGVPHRRGIFLHLFQVSGFLQHLDDLLAGDETVFTHQDAGFLVQLTVLVDDVQHLQVVPEADLRIVDIVRRSHLQASGTKVHLYVIILNHRDFPVDQRDQDFLSAQPVMALVVRIDADGGIGHDGFRTGGRDHEELVSGISFPVGNIIPQMIEVALGVLMDHFIVADGSKRFRVPVDHPDALVNPALLVEVNKRIDHRLGQSRFHRKARPVPVTGSAQFPQLVQNDSAMLLFPCPGMLQELFPGQVVLGNALGLQLGHDLRFGRNGSMVRSRYPAGVLPMHAGIPDQNIIQRIVQHMAHVQDSRHIGRRNHDRIRFLFVGLGMEELVFQPIGIPFVLHFGGVVLGS